MSMLTAHFYTLLEQGWQEVFPQSRTHRRAIEHALALPCSLGRRTVSRSICALNRQHQDWSADYKIFSRSPWQQDRLFDPVLDHYLQCYPQGAIALAMDDTKLAKRGKKISTAFWQRDPMSPPFHVNFLYGLRFIQASLLFPHYREGDFSARSFPVRFREAPAVKKPGKRATPEQRRQYREQVKQCNLSQQSLQVLKSVRASLDERGATDRLLWAVLDGSFCNRTFFRAVLERTELVARCRKDARLCFPAAPGSRRRYAPERFTPEQVRQDESIAWRQSKICFGAQRRRVRYKELSGILWKRGAGTRRLRLIVIAPQPYKLSPRARTHYRQPAYLLTTDTDSSAHSLIQAYFDRWQIEVNHREEKDILGVGQAQVWSPLSVPRHPAFAVATYSLLLLASLKAFGPGRTSDFLALPKWRKKAKRPSLLDLLTLLRRELNETSISTFLNTNMTENALNYAYT